MSTSCSMESMVSAEARSARAARRGERESAARKRTCDHVAVEPDRCLLTGVARVEVRPSGNALVPIHPGRDPVEGADARHGSTLTRRPTAAQSTRSASAAIDAWFAQPTVPFHRHSGGPRAAARAERTPQPPQHPQRGDAAEAEEAPEQEHPSVERPRPALGYGRAACTSSSKASAPHDDPPGSRRRSSPSRSRRRRQVDARRPPRRRARRRAGRPHRRLRVVGQPGELVARADRAGARAARARRARPVHAEHVGRPGEARRRRRAGGRRDRRGRDGVPRGVPAVPRLLERDGEAMREQWLAWMAEEDNDIAHENPAERVDAVVPGLSPERRTT